MRLASLASAALLPAFSHSHTLDKEKSAAMLDTAAKEGVEVPAKASSIPRPIRFPLGCVTLPGGQAADKLTFDIRAGQAPECWNVHVKLGSMEAPAPHKPDQKILSAAKPQLTEAKRNSDSITAKGKQVDTSGCGGMQPKPADVTVKLNSTPEATLSRPADAKKGDWTVHAPQGADDVSNSKLKERRCGI